MNISEFSKEQRIAILDGDYQNDVLLKVAAIEGGKGETAEGIFEIVDYKGFNELFEHGKMKTSETTENEYIIETLDDYYSHIYYLISDDREDILTFLTENIEDEADFNESYYDLFKLNELYILLR